MHMRALRNSLHTGIAVILLSSIAVGQAPTPSSPAVPGSKVWIGHYAEYEQFLRNAEVDRTVDLGSATRVFFKPGGLAASAALKSHGTKSEIAGYRLDRVLGLDMVPPTVEARYKGEMTGLMLWVLNVRELQELNDEHLRAPDPVKWAYQLNRLHTFEDLVANLDKKKEGTPMVDPHVEPHRGGSFARVHQHIVPAI
jgi:hypothetical protein